MVPKAEGPPDLRAFRRELEALPCEPVSRRHPRNWIFRLKRAADFIGHARPITAGFFRKANPYPRPFEHVRFETEDGVTIAAWYGPPGGEPPKKSKDAPAEALVLVEDKPKPRRRKRGKRSKSDDEAPHAHDAPPFGLVLVPGMFSTKDDTVHKRRAIHIWRHWKVPVLVIDTRAFGESTGISTGGWKEAYDVHAAVQFLKEQSGARRVGVIAESLGGASALNALALDHESGCGCMDGGTLLWSAFVDLKDAVHYISSEPPEDHPFHIQWAAFRRLLKFKSHGGYERFDEYLDDAARVNGLADFDEMAELANPKWKTSLIKSPVLLVHARDDPVVPVRHARRMERYAGNHPHIQVITTAFGEHTGFEAMEPQWYWEITRRFFGHINDLEFPNVAVENR